MCSGPGLRRAWTFGSSRRASTTATPALVAPQGTTSASSEVKPRTVAYRSSNCARQAVSASSSEPSGSTSDRSANALTRSSRVTTFSIRSHAWATLTGTAGSSSSTGVSISTETAHATVAAALRSLGIVFSLALSSARAARASSLVDISTSNKVSASSTEAFSRCRTVASIVAVRRGSASRRSVGA